ncbi:hypothetical protein F5884DRAFT_854822 [Xylogone sp. PMI_703]|nr:hypothetical protein F5884DRAFT_854822 [Xylogone sp. PMI_703]
MPDSLSTNGADVLTETLNRLSKKDGVQTAIALDRTTGAILRTTGQFTVSNSSRSASQAPGNGAAGSLNLDDSTSNSNGSETRGGIEELAAMVWNFVNSAGELVQGLDSEDEVKLLRLRTRKQELVIVPDAKYLLVVVHDTSPA